MENKIGTFKEIYGDLFEEIFSEKYDVSLQGCNCFNCQGAGIVIPFKKYFNTDKFPMEMKGKGDINKLGQIDCKEFYLKNRKVYDLPIGVPGIECHMITICNCYSQYHYGKNHEDGISMPADYEALTLCLRKINFKYKTKKVVLPLICGGLAGGDPDIIRNIIKTELKNCDVTLVIFNK